MIGVWGLGFGDQGWGVRGVAPHQIYVMFIDIGDPSRSFHTLRALGLWIPEVLKFEAKDPETLNPEPEPQRFSGLRDGTRA